jgi:hypothetical protein
LNRFNSRRQCNQMIQPDYNATKLNQPAN